MRSSILTLAFSISLLPGAVLAQWQPDGVALSTAASEQSIPTIVSDGSGGAIVTWHDYRSGIYDIYVQRVNASGAPQWTADGVALCTAASDQRFPTIVSDGSGGAIVTWHDWRSGDTDIYAQRVNASGAPQWTADGVALSTALNEQSSPTIVSDGAGGAIVTWQDFRSGIYDIYAQRVNASGAVQWTANGVALCTATNDQLTPTIVADGSGGAIVTWQDWRSGTNTDIYAQRVNASGAPQWTADGIAVSTAANYQEDPTIASDGSTGAIVTWYDWRSGTPDIYAQRVNASGALQWTGNGVALSTAANNQTSPTIVSDGFGGAVVTWQDNRSGPYHIYAQRVNASGAVQWTADGVALCTAAIDQSYPTIVSDGSGGAIVTWQDSRSGNYDIYAQRVNASGAVQWTADGVAISTAVYGQLPPTIVSDGAGGAIVTWYDFRSGTSSDIYAQRVEFRYGYWGHPEPMITSVADVRGDQGGKVKVNWKAGDWDQLNLRTISHYSVWRATDAAAMQSAEAVTYGGAEPSRVPADFQGQAFWVQHGPLTDYYWEWVGNQDAKYFPTYSFSTSTRADSTVQGLAQHHFIVISETSDGYTFWPSNVMSGHSVDNLAPAAPLMLIAQRVGSDVQLKWNRVRVPDLRDYSVYRATSSGVTPIPGNFLANNEDTVLVDASAPNSALYYIVTAYDVHANQGAPSNEASVGATTGIGNTPPITALTVLQNYPNPFAGSTELSIGLPRESGVSIEIFDVAGRMVQSEQRPLMHAGWQRVALSDGGNDGKPLASGVYFCRVTAAGSTVTRKMVITR